MMQLQTPRLILRQWQEADYQDFAQLNADPEVMAYFPNILETQASDKLADRCRLFIEENGWGLWAVEHKESGDFIGFVGLNKPLVALPFSPCVEVGWRLAKSYWGKGLATEAAQEVLVFGFMTLALDEIVSFTTQTNLRSQAVMKRLGMDYRYQFDHPSLPKDSSLLTHYLYALTKEKWLSLK